MKEQPAPEGLKETGAAFWRQFTAERDLEGPEDLSDLARYCTLLDEERELMGQIAKDGAIIRDRYGRPKAHPACLLLRDTRKLLMQQGREMGFRIVETDDPRRPRLPF
jgi:P27 family predicted phage terminase small subunit